MERHGDLCEPSLHVETKSSSSWLGPQSHKRFSRPPGTSSVDPGPGVAGGAGTSVGWREGVRKRPGCLWSPGQSSNPRPYLSSVASTPCSGTFPGPLWAPPSLLPPCGWPSFLGSGALHPRHSLPGQCPQTQMVSVEGNQRHMDDRCGRAGTGSAASWVGRGLEALWCSDLGIHYPRVTTPWLCVVGAPGNVAGEASTAPLAEGGEV